MGGYFSSSRHAFRTSCVPELARGPGDSFAYPGDVCQLPFGISGDVGYPFGIAFTATGTMR